MDDDGPNFGYAYGESAAASWNPALRPTSRAPSPSEASPFTQPSIDADAFPALLHAPPCMKEPDVLGAMDAHLAHEKKVEHEAQAAVNPEPDSSAHVTEDTAAIHPTKEPTIDSSPRVSAAVPKDVPGVPEPAEPEAHAPVAAETIPAAGPFKNSNGPVDGSVTEQDFITTSEDAVKAYSAKENCEHQADITAVEDAVQEREAEPLVKNDATPIHWGSTGADDDFEFAVGDATSAAGKEQTIEEEHHAPTHMPDSMASSRADENAIIDWGASPSDDFVFSAPTQASETRGNDATAFETATEATRDVEEPAFDWGASDASEFPLGQVAEESTVDADFAAAFADENTTTDNDARLSSSNELTGKSETDLAAWQAAFGDDDLMDENAGASFFEDDGEGFLDDTACQVNEPSTHAMTTASALTAVAGIAAPTASIYSPAPTPQPLTRSVTGTYAPSGPQLTEPSQRNQLRPQTAYAGSGYQQPPAYRIPQPQPGVQSSGQSFSDKSKSGYASPYDLPDDLTKPRRRPGGSVLRQQTTPVPTPPPRTSSMGGADLALQRLAQGMLPPAQGRPPSSGAAVRPISSGSAYGFNAAAARGASLEKTTALPQPPSDSGFFAELPVPRSRQGTPSGRYTPQLSREAQMPQGQFQPFGQNAQGQQMPPQSMPHQQVSPQGSPQQQMPPHGMPPQQMLPHGLPSQQKPPQRTLAQQRPPHVRGEVQPPTMNYDPYSGQLRQPDAPPMFPDAPSHVPAGAAPPIPHSTRYSPALLASNGGSSMVQPPVANTRYSPAPPSQVPPSAPPSRYAADQSGLSRPPPARQFLPRTSSPLAHFSSPSPNGLDLPAQQKSLPQVTPAGNYHLQQQQLPPIQLEPFGQPLPVQQTGYQMGPPFSTPQSTSPSPPAQALPTMSPRKHSTYSPLDQLPSVSEQGVLPLMRSQSQSPGSHIPNKVAVLPMDRPASAFDLPSPKRAVAEPVRKFSLPHHRGFSQEMNFIEPQDERIHDPLGRWKGCPIFSWGAGGHVISSFPKHVPRYGGGQAAPKIKSSPGEVKVLNVKAICPSEDSFALFPGPLKKSKKKEVVAWLKSTIATLEAQPTLNGMAAWVDLKKVEEKVLLWKVMLVLVEHDGVLEGTPAVQEAVQAVLKIEGRPELPLLTRPSDREVLVSAESTSSKPLMTEAVRSSAVGRIRGLLSQGQREDATWLAVDERLWGHAMLISSTMSKDIWRQVVQEFVRKEVKAAGIGNEPLSALYEVFAGNWEDSIDQLVPASARAGFQMISTMNPTPGAQDASAGLDKWRETLLLILSNRTPDDGLALIALGKLLSGYGRVEAAHICFLFARSNIYFGGAEDPQSQVTLIGSDPRRLVEFGQDMESIMLTEVYEFALSLGSSAPSVIPHLQAYKLYHAFALVEAGFRNEAQQYGDVIASLVSSKTRLSPYYHPIFMAKLEDLLDRLKQTPVASSSSMFAKPSMDKVGSSLLSKFHSFVAGGDDGDAVSNGSGAVNEVGPFARIAGDTPTISRSASVADLYSPYTNGTAVPGHVPPSNSRYAPTNGSVYAPRTLSDQARPNPYAPQSARTSLESTRPGESAYSPAASESNPHGSLQAPFIPQTSGNVIQPLSTTANHNPPQQRSYAPTPKLVSRTASYQSVPAPNGAAHSGLASHALHNLPHGGAYSPMPYQATPEPESAAPRSLDEPRQPSPLHQPSHSYQPDNSSPQDAPRGYEPLASDPPPTQISLQQPPSFDDPPPPQPSYQLPNPNTGYDASTSSYEPPVSNYEPPSYQPYEPDPDTLTDDDDDIDRRAAALKSQPASLGASGSDRAARDKAADDAFRKAAEADANRPNARPLQHKSSWLGSWFSKKDPNAQQTGPIKAKLGEESSFVYDTDLKKWVNKKVGAAGDTQPATGSAPPPPKGMMPPRSFSGSGGTPPPGAMEPPRIRAASGPTGAMGPPSRAASGTSVPVIAGSGPPSRVATPADGSAEIGPGSGTAPVMGSGPPSRPTTSMSNASSLNDLMGPAVGRKGTVRKKGRGGRYVDVMANQG